MPVTIAKIKKGKKKCFKVKTPHGTTAKCTSKKKAERQRRLLNALERGYLLPVQGKFMHNVTK